MFNGSSFETPVRNLKGFGIATIPGVQGKGIAAALCQYFITCLKQKNMNCNFFLSGINANTHKMHAFLQKFGVTVYKTHQTFTIKI
jgi:GNAT superfamily N-acetyltransferase